MNVKGVLEYTEYQFRMLVYVEHVELKLLIVVAKGNIMSTAKSWDVKGTQKGTTTNVG